MLVVETGRRTAFGTIAARLKARPPETEFERGIRQFGYLLIRVMIGVVLFVLSVNLLLGRPLIDSLLFAVALAVGLTPELLPAIINVTLAAVARAMAKQGVIVRRLDSIENLGSLDLFCNETMLDNPEITFYKEDSIVLSIRVTLASKLFRKSLRRAASRL